MSCLRTAWSVLAAAIAANGVNAQIAWSTMPPPPGQGVFAYDGIRDRLVCVDAIRTSEFDGTSWSSTAAPWTGISWVEFDEARGRTVVPGTMASTGGIWEWDGVAWTLAASPNPTIVAMAGGGQTAFHLGLGGIAVGVHGAQEYELYTWDGVSAVRLPATGAPPIHPPFSNNRYYYDSLCYDARNDRLVLFGRQESDQYGIVGHVAITWEWDPVNGWVNLGVSGTMLSSSTIWYDAHRGAVVRYDEGGSATARAAYVRQPGGTWSPLAVQGTPRLGDWGCHDWRRNRYYIWWGTTPSAPMGYLGDVYPSTFDPHANGCSAAGAPTLDLSASWTRAWLGDTLSLEVGNLVAPVAVLTMGFSDQTFSGNALPLSLSGYGMPQCSLNVAAEASALAAAAGGTATFSIPVPSVLSLVGVRYYQQAFAPVAGANPLGMLASDSVTGTVGRSQ